VDDQMVCMTTVSVDRYIGILKIIEEHAIRIKGHLISEANIDKIKKHTVDQLSYFWELLCFSVIA
jgi:hypothetical protein